jgi:transposase
VERVVADQLDDARLEEVYRIGVDEVSYRKGHRYLTVVADHDRDGAVIWAGEGKRAATLELFYDQLGETRTAQLQAVSMDLGAAFKKATDTRAPQARQCADPFHVVALANEAINKARRWAWNLEREKAKTRPRRPTGRPRRDSPPPPRDQARWGGTPADVGHLVSYLVSDASRFVSGASITASAGSDVVIAGS